MAKSSPVVFPEELRAKYFSELSPGENPPLAALRERILELDEAGRPQEAAELLPWIEKLKPKESGVSKASKITIFVLFVVAGILGVLWFFANPGGGGVAGGGKSELILVCSINGEIFTGEMCSPELAEQKLSGPENPSKFR